MRFGKIGAKRMMWRNPYVTDGLVAWWDGIWNAGFGVHDSNAMSWKDLVRGIDCPYSDSSTPQWGNNCCQFPYTGINQGKFFVTSLPAGLNNQNGGSTIELVFRRTSSLRGTIFGGSQYGTAPDIAVHCGVSDTYSIYVYNLTAGTDAAPMNQIVKMTHLRDSRNLTIRCGGKSNSMTADSYYFRGVASGLKMNIGCDADGYYNNCGDIYSLRLYSRILTSSEQSANDAADRIRFNLS